MKRWVPKYIQKSKKRSVIPKEVLLLCVDANESARTFEYDRVRRSANSRAFKIIF